MLELLQKRRSIRRYKSDPVEKEKIERIVQAALLSPSSRALNPWEFIIVDKPDLLSRLAKAKEHGSSFLRDAPLGIVVLGDPERCDVWVEDCSIATLLIHLTSASLGLGSCWIQVRERRHDQNKTAEDYIREVLNIPENKRVEAIVSIGYALEGKNAKPIPKIPNPKVHYNGFGAPY